MSGIIADLKYKLSDAQKQKLFDDYYNTDKPTNELISEFNLNGLKASHIYLLFDDVESNIKCEFCATPMKYRAPSRSKKEENNQDLYCPSCNHKIYGSRFDNCTCFRCRKKQEQLVLNYIRTDRTKQKGSLNTLDVGTRLLLGTIYLHTMESLNPITEKRFLAMAPLVPKKGSRRYDFLHGNYHFWEYLKNNFLVLSDINNAENFRFLENNTKIDGAKDTAIYELWINEQDISRLEPNNIFDTKSQVYETWIKINKKECETYLYNIFTNFTEPYDNGHGDTYDWIDDINDSAQRIVELYIRTFSLLETLTAFRVYAKQYSFDCLMGKLSPEEAGNYIVKDLFDHYIHRMTNETMNTDRYPFDYSLVTSFFYNNVLNLGDIGYTLVPKQNGTEQ